MLAPQVKRKIIELKKLVERNKISSEIVRTDAIAPPRLILKQGDRTQSIPLPATQPTRKSTGRFK